MPGQIAESNNNMMIFEELSEEKMVAGYRIIADRYYEQLPETNIDVKWESDIQYKTEDEQKEITGKEIMEKEKEMKVNISRKDRRNQKLEIKWNKKEKTITVRGSAWKEWVKKEQEIFEHILNNFWEEEKKEMMNEYSKNNKCTIFQEVESETGKEPEISVDKKMDNIEDNEEENEHSLITANPAIGGETKPTEETIVDIPTINTQEILTLLVEDTENRTNEDEARTKAENTDLAASTETENTTELSIVEDKTEKGTNKDEEIKLLNEKIETMDYEQQIKELKDKLEKVKEAERIAIELVTKEEENKLTASKKKITTAENKLKKKEEELQALESAMKLKSKIFAEQIKEIASEFAEKICENRNTITKQQDKILQLEEEIRQEIDKDNNEEKNTTRRRNQET